MFSIGSFGKILGVAAAAFVLASCETTRVGSEHKAEAVTGPRIQMGVGHFAKDKKPFHYWDKEKGIPAVCARCHAATGVAQYLKEGKNTPAPHVKNGFACANCHADMLTYARHSVTKVTFASGATVDSGNSQSNLCMTCHQGRESTASVNKAIAGRAPDTPDPKIPFVHVHYFPAGATLFGTQAKVAYEYPGKSYAGRARHPEIVSNCTDCHEPHSGELKGQQCAACHKAAKESGGIANIRVSKGDFDGNGREEGIGREVANEKAELYAAIQQYARTVSGKPIAFSPEAYPYWYADLNGNGRVDPEELRPDNGYKAYSPRLLQAVYNYTFALRDPGAAFHNGRYTLQLLYDSLESLSQKVPVEMRGKLRP